MNDIDKLIRRIFDEAAEFSGGGRVAFLDRACAGQPELHLRVEELLAAHDRAGGFLQAPAVDKGAGGTVRLSLPQEENAGQSIGRYKLLQQIGEGGCGVVYMAEQQEPVKRRVALKVIKLGMDTRQVIARFEAERQALALMDHPNIAKVLDAGATETGRPFFVMELVRGIKITDYCDQNNLSTEERLGLFTQVCQAIQHAHQKGIIHRDIKPSNILVTMHDGIPVPKVIDFGIAKATTGQQLTDKTLFTAFEQFIGTPAYMSPEQAEMSGLDIDTRSDIYALGVLLYELLTGNTPFDGKELVASGIDAMRRTIREREPARPSNRLSTMMAADLSAIAKHRKAEPAKLTSLIRGDLDWIAMKALEKDRTRRYETANGLSMDVQRFLRNEPVVARPPSRVYRLQKSVLRNKLIFAAGTAVVVALLVGLAISTRSLWFEKQARQRALAAAKAAELEANKREQMAKLLKDMLARVSSQVSVGRDTKFLTKILDQTASRFASELRDQPAVEAELRKEVGQIYYDLGDYASAVTIDREAIRLKELAGEKQSKSIAELYDYLGVALEERGDLDDSEAAYRKSLALKKTLFGEASAEYADPLVDLGLTFWLRGDLAEAERLTRQGLELKRKFPGGGDDLAATINNLGLVLWEQGRVEEALPLLKESYTMSESLLGNHPEMAYGCNNLALAMRDGGQLLQAQNLTEEALRLLPDNHPLAERARGSLTAILRRQAAVSGNASLIQEAFQLSPQDPLTADCLSAVFVRESLTPLFKSGEWRLSRATPSPDWITMDFPDKEWPIVPFVTAPAHYAPYSPRIDRSVRFHTNLWLRREFVLTNLPAGNLVLQLNRCQDAEVFINGINAVPAIDWTDGIVVARLSKNAQAALRTGRNVLAVHCLDADGGTTVDVGIFAASDPLLGRHRLLEEFDSMIQASPPRANAYAGRGGLHARQAHWQPAADDLKRAMTLAPQSLDICYQLAPVLLTMGDAAAYNRHREAVLQAFPDPNTPSDAGAVALLSLLTPAEGAGLQSAAALAERAASARYFDKGLVPRQLAKGLAEYRQGHFPSAVEWMQKARENAARRDQIGWTHERERNRSATALVVEAMALHRLSNAEPARAAIAKARNLVQTQLPEVDSGDLGREWQEWLIVHLLLHEAEDLITSPKADVSTHKPTNNPNKPSILYE